MQFGIANRVSAISRVDVAIAASVVGLGQLEIWLNGAIAPKLPATVCELVLGAVLVLRRQLPLLTVAIVSVAASGEAIAKVPLQQPLVPLVAMVVAIFTLVSRATRERAATGAVIALAAVAVQTASQHKGLSNFVFALVFLIGAWIAGRMIHARTLRAHDLEREHANVAAVAAEEERRRIARELHDVIAHSLGILVLQAGAAEQIVERDPKRARETLQLIRASGLEAISELGTLLAVARGEPDRSRQPHPRLADLDSLLAATTAAGLPVELRIDGRHRELPAAVELSAYRIVQEGLTNALKHAGATHATVLLQYGDDTLAVRVDDDGAASRQAEGSRRGLAGLRERVALFGGRFHAAARPDGGWRLEAILPLPR